MFLKYVLSGKILLKDGFQHIFKYLPKIIFCVYTYLQRINAVIFLSGAKNTKVNRNRYSYVIFRNEAK